jgi:hypothetical protein
VDRPDIVGRELDDVYLPALASPDHDVFVVLEALASEAGRLMVSESDGVLLHALKDRGFSPVHMDHHLGIVELRRPVPKSRPPSG